MAKHKIVADICYYHKCHKENCSNWGVMCKPDNPDSEEACWYDDGICLNVDEVIDGKSNRQRFHELLDEFIDNSANHERIDNKMNSLLFHVCDIHKIEHEEE